MILEGIIIIIHEKMNYNTRRYNNNHYVTELYSNIIYMRILILEENNYYGTWRGNYYET